MTVRLTEDDFLTEFGGVEVPVIELESSSYDSPLVAYGHIGREEFLEWCSDFYRLNSDDTDIVSGDEDITWAWAKGFDTVSGTWNIKWNGVSKDDEDAFPVTLLWV